MQGEYIALSVGTVTQTTAHFAPWIRLVSPTGVLLGNSFTLSFSSYVAPPALPSFPTRRSSDLYLGGFYDGIGSYRLTLAQGPGAVVVSAGDEGGPMTDGATNAGSIYQGDFDTWTDRERKRVYFSQSTSTEADTTAQFNHWIRLVSPTGVLLGILYTPTWSSNITASAPTCGPHPDLLSFPTRRSSDLIGSYRLTLAQGPGAVVVSAGDEGGPMTDGATNAGNIYQGDFDTWTFTATQEIGRASCRERVNLATADFAAWNRLVTPCGGPRGDMST